MTEYTIVITEPINQMGVKFLIEQGVEVINLQPGEKEEKLLEMIPLVDGLITRGSIKITRELMKASPRLKVVGVHGIGCDHVDLDAARELGKIVCNTPDALTVTVAEMTIALILASMRNIVSADKAVRKGEWNRKYTDLIGDELSGKRIGIIGLGRIGTLTAKLLQSFDVELVYWSRTRKPETEEEIEIQWLELHEVLQSSDIISFHIPATTETYHLIGEEEFNYMKDGIRIINTARGKVINQKALIKALETGKVRSAALDVFEIEPISVTNPLCNMDNVILTPHLAASNHEGMQRMAVQVAKCVLTSIKGGTPENPVVM